MKNTTNLRWLWGVLIAAFIVMQFIGNRPETKKDNPADLLATAKVPADVSTILRNSCYDCHSNETVYPWYAHVAPVSWLVNHDVSEGREELNFSEWDNLKLTKKAKMLDKISEEVVEEGDMPMAIYVVLHKKAKLSDADRKKIGEWVDVYAEQLFGK